MGWGDAIITQLERDMKREIPNLEGFFRRNPYRMLIALSCPS
ncbi:hypothetical protein H6F93_22515 [Leptolyngbya sp. FACHB-671]|nr:hypothetical protein [Leptolyngbya sp. FACHB-671]